MNPLLSAIEQNDTELVNSLGLSFVGDITKGDSNAIGQSAGNVGIFTAPLGNTATEAQVDANKYDNRVKAEQNSGIQSYINQVLAGLQTLGTEALIYGAFLLLFALLVYAFVSSNRQ